MSDLMRPINHIIVLTSETRRGEWKTVKSIDRRDRLRLFKRMIGVHRLVYLDGTVHDGRPLSERGDFAPGYNHDSIGVAYVGGMNSAGRYPDDTRTPEQKAGLYAEMVRLKGLFPQARIIGLGDLPRRTACSPGFNAGVEYAGL